jgi:hypothetical protein
MLLTFITATWNQPPCALLVKLFCYYQLVKAAPGPLTGHVYLNDRTLRAEIFLDQAEALQIIQTRFTYLAELIVSQSHSGGEHQLLSAFLNDFASPKKHYHSLAESHLQAVIRNSRLRTFRKSLSIKHSSPQIRDTLVISQMTLSPQERNSVRQRQPDGQTQMYASSTQDSSSWTR